MDILWIDLLNKIKKIEDQKEYSKKHPFLVLLLNKDFQKCPFGTKVPILSTLPLLVNKLLANLSGQHAHF